MYSVISVQRQMTMSVRVQCTCAKSQHKAYEPFKYFTLWVSIMFTEKQRKQIQNKMPQLEGCNVTLHYVLELQTQNPKNREGLNRLLHKAARDTTHPTLLYVGSLQTDCCWACFPSNPPVCKQKHQKIYKKEQSSSAVQGFFHLSFHLFYPFLLGFPCIQTRCLHC